MRARRRFRSGPRLPHQTLPWGNPYPAPPAHRLTTTIAATMTTVTTRAVRTNYDRLQPGSWDQGDAGDVQCLHDGIPPEQCDYEAERSGKGRCHGPADFSYGELLLISVITEGLRRSHRQPSFNGSIVFCRVEEFGGRRQGGAGDRPMGRSRPATSFVSQKSGRLPASNSWRDPASAPRARESPIAHPQNSGWR